MARENFSLELRRNLALKINELISDTPLRASEINRSVRKLKVLDDSVSMTYVSSYFLPKIMTDILGNIKIDNKYFVSDREIAKDMINEYFDRLEDKKSDIATHNTRDLNLWINIRQMASIIDKFSGITTGELRERYRKETGKSLTLPLIDKYNGILASYNIPIEFYEKSRTGERMRLTNSNTLRVIDKVISDLTPKRLRDKLKDEKKSTNELTRLSKMDLDRLKLNLLDIIYLGDARGVTLPEITSNHSIRYKRNISDNTIRLILNELIKIGLVYDKSTMRYKVDNYHDILAVLNPKKLNLDITIAVNEGVVPNLRGLENGTKVKSCTIGNKDIWEVTGYNSKELTKSLVMNVCRGDIEIISPIYIRDRIRELIEINLANMIDVI